MQRYKKRLDLCRTDILGLSNLQCFMTGVA